MQIQLGVLILTPVSAMLSYAILLVMVLRRSARSRFYLAFSFYVFVMVVWSFGSTMMRLDPNHLLWWNRLQIAGAVLMPLAYFGFALAFLDERQTGWLRVGLAAAAVLEVANLAGLIISDAQMLEGGLISYDTGPLLYLAAAYGAFFLGFSAWLLARAYRRTSDPTMRGRIRYPLIGLSLVTLGIASNAVPALRLWPLEDAANLINAWLLAYAILRYQLLDVTTVVRTGLVYSIATIVIGILYFLIVFVAIEQFRLVTGYQVLILALVMAAITVATIQPLRDRLQSWVDRRFFREKYDLSMMLQRLSHTGASVLDLDKLTRMILDEVTTTMRIDSGAFFLKHEESGEFRLRAQRGLDGNNGVQLGRSHPVVAWLSLQERVLTKHDLETLLQFRALSTQERDELETIGAELFVPLQVREELIGILVLGRKPSETSFSDDEQRTLTTLANQTAVAIENARLFSLEQRKAEESSALLDIARAVSSTLDLTPLLQVIAQRTAEVCGVDRCSILLIDEERGTLTPLMSQFVGGDKNLGLWEIFREQVRAETIDQVPLVNQVLMEGKPLALDEESMSLLPSRWIDPFGVRSLLAVPLISEDHVIGLMVLDHTEEGHRFFDEQIALATTIGSQVTIAVEKARLYEETVEEKERTQTILERAFAGIMVIDPTMRILTLNPEVEVITGFTSQELEGKRLIDVFGPELWGEESLLSEVMATGERSAPVEAILTGKNGARDILLGVTPVRDGYLLNFADITRLKEVDRLKSSIVANVSHELRAPLASIKAYTELLLDDLEGDDRLLRHRFLSTIDQEADALAELINDLLDLSRLESEEYAARMDLLSMSEVIDGVIDLLDFQVRMSEVDVHCDIPGNLPLIEADKELVKILVKNLLSNAVKFSSAGGRVDVGAREVGTNLVLDVVDRGMGIPPEDLPKLFTKFYRSVSAKEAGIRGTGLGLVLAKEAVEVHKGTIEVESALGVGTRFTVTLPIKREPGTDGQN